MRLTVCIGVWCLAAVLGRAETAPPNILFFLVDDMGVTDTSVPFLYDAEGRAVAAPLNSRYRTPQMERLAGSGRKFTEARAYAVCSPTRTALLSGWAAERLHITTWTHPAKVLDTGDAPADALASPAWRMAGLDPDQPNLARLLQSAGYRTIHCGKAHFGPDETPSGNPLRLGFDINIGGYGGGGPGSYWGEKNFSAAWRGGGRDWDVPGLEPYHGKDIFLTEALTREMIAAIRDAVAADKPFFAYMSHYAVHAPFETDSRFAANYPDLQGMPLAFATLVEGMDKSLGDLLDALGELGVADNTLVVFYSDNGSDGPPNLPLRGRKGTRFDGGSRVPMIVSWAKPNPEHPAQSRLPVPAGTRDDTLVTPPDFLPTLAAAAGIKLPADLTTDGRDLTAAFSGKPESAGQGQFLVHFPHGRHNNSYYTTWTDGGWKLSYQYAPRQWELYHLAADPFETRDLAAAEPARARSMTRDMLAALEARGAQFPRERKTGATVKPDLDALPPVPEAHAAPKSVILMIGDGMGPEQVKAARCYHGGPLSFEKLELFPHQARMTTGSASHAVTDSAAGGTAIATGVKVANGVISLRIPGDGKPLPTVLEHFRDAGKLTGLVTTATVTHATPAAFGAHQPSRGNVAEIAADYLTLTRPTVLFGGGANGMSRTAAREAGYTVVEDRSAMNGLVPGAAPLVLGHFGKSQMPYEADGPDGYARLPHLREMTAKALDLLSHGDQGFFLMVEGGRIDHAGHDNHLPRLVHETLEFSRAVEAARAWAADRDDILILVTADHETGGLEVTRDQGRGKMPEVTWSTKGHTAVPVPVYAWGAGAGRVTGTLDNTGLVSLMIP